MTDYIEEGDRMKEKVLAVFMSAVMVMAALAVVMPVQAADPEPDTVLIGGDDPYLLTVGGTVKAKIDFNYIAYESPVVNATIGTKSIITNGTGQSNVEIGNDIKITVTGGPSVYELTVTGVAATTGTAAMKNIDLTLVDNVPLGVDDTTTTDVDESIRSVTLNYIYGIFVKVVPTGSAPTVIVEEGSTPVVHDDKTDIFTFQKGVDYKDAIAYVKIGDSKLDYNDYDFYAIGLPEGIYMKSTGEIAGKLKSDVQLIEFDTETPEATTNKTFKVYAVNKTSESKTILVGEFGYEVVLDTSSFMYQITSNGVTGEKVTYDVVGYAAIKNTDGLTIGIFDSEGNAVVAANYNKYTMTYYASDSATGPTSLSGSNVFTIAGQNGNTPGALESDSGIVQINITDGKYTAIIHVMVVGPVVHSGLAPAVTSA